MNYSLMWLPSVLRDNGLAVEETSGWQTRGHGDVGSIKGVICHHTAGAKTGNSPSLGIVTNGRPDLGGPLAQLVLGRNGTYYMVAAGKAWHAGAGIWQGVHDGNSSMIGIEAENTGLENDCPWPVVQMEAYAKGVAAILKHVGARPIMCVGHLEWATPVGRKSDPSFSVGTRAQRIVAMDDFRKKVASFMNIHPTFAVAPDATGTENTQWLQASLNTLGADPELVVDGDIGPKTIQALKMFQKSNNLESTGAATPETLSKIHDALGHHEGCNCNA